MITKTENCLYCGEKMESETAKKKFCSDKCRVYYKREKDRGTLIIPKVGEVIINSFPTIDNNPVVVTKRKQHNHSLTLTVKSNIPPMPEKMIGENGIDYAARKNEWKLKYGQK